MNRIHPFHVACFDGIGGRSRTAEEQAPRLHRDQGDVFFLPSGYTPRYDYPLVVWLHHDGGTERDVCQVLPLMSVQNYVGVGVRGCRATESSGLRFGWSDSPASVAVAEQAVFSAIDAASERYSINPSKIFLVGYYQGGTAALRLGLRHPHRFAGVASLGGAIPEGGRVFGNLQRARGLPLYLATYRDSESWPVEQVCQQIRMLHTAKMKAEVRQYPQAGDLCTQMLADLNRWLMSIVLGTPVVEESSDRRFSDN